MEAKWFVLCEDHISGPFQTEALERAIKSEEWPRGSLVWWRGQKEWLPIELWDQLKPDMTSFVPGLKEEPQWYIELSGQVEGPLEFGGFLSRLKGIDGLHAVRIWSTNFTEWKSVFECPEITGQIELGLRKYPRAPIQGTACIVFDDCSINLNLDQVGQGGFSADKLEFEMIKGSKVQATLTSASLPAPIRTTASFVSLSANGTAGFEFSQISQENVSILVSYVNTYFDKLDESSVIAKAPDDKQQWYTFFAKEKKGPMDLKEIQLFLKGVRDRNRVQVWRAGMSRWAFASEVPEIEKLFGPSRRKTERAAIIGTLQSRVPETGENTTFELISIMPDGCGVRGWNLKTGDKLECQLHSQLLPQLLEFEAEVVHAGENGEAGLKFINISKENLSVIGDYMERFTSALNPRRKAS